MTGSARPDRRAHAGSAAVGHPDAHRGGVKVVRVPADEVG